MTEPVTVSLGYTCKGAPDVGYLLVTEYPVGYGGQEECALVDRADGGQELVTARLVIDGASLCVVCHNTLDDRWVFGGHKFECYLNPVRSNSPRQVRRATWVSPIARPYLAYRAFERLPMSPPDPWWIVELGPGKNDLLLGHDEFSMLFFERKLRQAETEDLEGRAIRAIQAIDAHTTAFLDPALRNEVASVVSELLERLEAISLSYIEVSNPGIDMDAVKRERAERRQGVAG